MAPVWAGSHGSLSSGWSGRAPRLAILPAIEPIPSRRCHVESAVADEKAEVRRETNSRQQFLPLSFRAEREISQRDPSGLACVRARIQPCRKRLAKREALSPLGPVFPRGKESMPRLPEPLLSR